MTASDLGDRGRQWLDRLFAGDTSIPAIIPVALAPADRTVAEHAAVARAAACRDLFVIHADPAAGERVIVDVARAVTDRVLVLSPNPGAADRVAERLLKCGVTVLRALADDENPTRPSPAVSKVTSVALGTGRAEQSRREAVAEVAEAEAKIAAFASVSKALARLTEVNDSLTRLDADLAERTAVRDRIEADLRAETDTPFALALAKLQTDHDDASAKLASELQAASASHGEKDAALTQARNVLAEAARKPGFLSRLFSSKAKPGTADPVDLEKQVHTLETEVGALAEQVRELQAKLDASRATIAAERSALVANELTSRRAVSETAIAAIEDEHTRALAEVAALNKVITAAVPDDDYTIAQQRLTTAREKATQLTRSESQITARVVVGTPGSLGTDPVFAALTADPPFGVLVLDRAEELPEAEFPRLARLAERWVLVGHALLADDPRPPSNHNRSRGPRPGQAEGPFTVRLAKTLDREAWAIEGDRFVCRLAHLTPDQRRTVTREPLADRPEIELRFTTTEGDPQLAEIAFPNHVTVAAAKSLLFHELGEVLLRPCGDLCWTHGAETITATWSTDSGSDGVWIDLEAGVREKVVGAGPFAFTVAVSFDPAAGWDAERAAAWVAARLPAPSLSRFAALPRTPGSRPGA